MLPLGIVRTCSETEMLNLISFGRNTDITVPSAFQPVIDSISTLRDGCRSCYRKGYHKMFFSQSNLLGNLMLFSLIIFIQTIVNFMSGCQTSTSIRPTFGQTSDLTEDMYHRLKAGLFEPENDPMIAEIIRKKSKNPFHKIGFPFYSNKAPHTMVRLSWERGSFWVKSDDHAYIVIYMDMEATFSHVQLATLEGFGNIRKFRAGNERPIR